MQRNTTTTFGELRQGDRFYFVGDSDKKAYQLTEQKRSGKSSYNIVVNGENAWQFDRQAAGNRPVVFLRHTKPLPGEECLLSDLKEGDMFFFPEDVVSEYLVADTAAADIKDRYQVIASCENAMPDCKPKTVVFFLRKQLLQK